MQKLIVNRHLQTLLSLSTLLGGAFAVQPSTSAQMALQCEAQSVLTNTLSNQAQGRYNADEQEDSSLVTASPVIKTDVNVFDSTIQTVPQGLQDVEGNRVVSLGMLTVGLESSFETTEMTADVAQSASLQALETFVVKGAKSEATLDSVLTEVRTALQEDFPEQETMINELSDETLTLALTGTDQDSLLSAGLNPSDAQTGEEEAIAVFSSLAGNTPFAEVTEQLQGAVSEKFSSSSIPDVFTALNEELARVRASQQMDMGEEIIFTYVLQNTGRSPANLQIPTAETLQNEGLTGSGTVVQVAYLLDGNSEPIDSTNTGAAIELAPQQEITLLVKVKPDNFESGKTNTVGIDLAGGCEGNITKQEFTFVPGLDRLVDPFGNITGCDGELLEDYRGFSVAIYNADPNDPTGGLAGLTPLTTTELPDNPDNNIPAGIEPNVTNVNPYFLTNEDQGFYSFLFDENKGQLDKGRTYILLVNPPEDSIYEQRRIRLVIGDRNGDVVRYTATALDGKPISATTGETAVEGEITIEDANVVGLNLAALDLNANVCLAQELRITKTADRAAAEPGDTVLYRLTVKSLSNTNLDNIRVNDVLPDGFAWEPKVTRASLNGEEVDIEAENNGRSLTFNLEQPLPEGGILNIIYAAQINPDALRGNGKNSASVAGVREDVGTRVQDGPAIHSLVIRPGILSDCGTLIGRVFVDKNFDGLQQPGEPGVPNAVIFLQDGNRITTDADGLFSLSNVLPGYHVGVLDLTSIPGYAIAPNIRFSEGNSKSRMVRISPGSLGKMNFAVTPTSEEDER